MDHVYDVAVVGAGPGGSAAAHYLAQQGRDVLLLDKSDFPRDKTCGDGLTPRALDILRDMGILDQAERAGFRINGLELYAKGDAKMVAAIPKHRTYPDHLLIIPRLKLDDLIRRRAMDSGAHFESPVRVGNLQYEEDHVLLLAERGGKTISFKAKMVILAIGANLGLLKAIGLLNRLPRTLVAVRAYYEGMRGLNDRVQAFFDSVPMPGYGWIFPISANAANVGVGIQENSRAQPSVSLRSALDLFLHSPKLAPMMAGAKQVGSVKSYPLRIDFTSAPTYGERVLLVGETAGLVSPLTGEGIDFALESGKLCAEFLADAFERGDFSRSSLSGYDKILRAHFQSIFRFLGYIRQLYLHPALISRLVVASARSQEVRNLALNVLMSQQHPAEMFRLGTLRSIFFGARSQ